MQKPIVYFTPVHSSKDTSAVTASFKKILRIIPWDTVFPGKFHTAIKLHFGEKNNTGHVPPPVIKCLIDKMRAQNLNPFLTDSNVLYHGGRTNAVEHLHLAYKHGFTYKNCGAPIIIADGLFGEHVCELPVQGKHFKTVKAAGIVKHLHGMISVAHYTGHMLTGFGGTIKNIGMGMANRAGKQLQHSAIKPTVIEKSCTFCKKCISVCPVHAIIEKNEKAHIDREKCIGCADCVVACQFKAIEITWEESIPATEEKMVEYTSGILHHIPHTYFINYALRITKECDCLAEDDPSVVEDIGILASDDPIALDKATLDVVLKKAGCDIFKKLHPESDYHRQLEYAAALGLGKLDYTVQEIV